MGLMDVVPKQQQKKKEKLHGYVVKSYDNRGENVTFNRKQKIEKSDKIELKSRKERNLTKLA